MNIEDKTTEELEELSVQLLNDITRISDRWHNTVPAFKAMLVQIENELYRREL